MFSRFRLGILCALALWGAWLLLLRIQFELAGAYHTDTSIYLTVGRGILNGLTPYRDLYENKPPGIFLLAALSLKFFGDVTLLTVLQALVLLLLPLCLVQPVAFGDGWPTRNAERMLCAWLLGCVLVFYTASMAGTLLPESFGAFFGSAFIAVLASRDRITWPVRIVLAVLLLCAAGIKEPFFLSTLAGVLVILPSWKAVRHIVPSILIAIAAGLVGMILLGYLWPYITINLAHLLGFHVFNPWGTVGEPLWLRMIDLPRIAMNMAAVSPALPFIVGSLWLGAVVLPVWQARSRASRTEIVARWMVASLFATLSVGLTGDFYGHHFIFAVPLFTGCALVCLREWGALSKTMRTGVPVAFMGLSAWMFLTMPTDYAAMLRDWNAWAAPRREAAAILDRVMDTCGVDRYFDFIDRPEGFYGFTRHSPHGPIFTQYGRFIGALQVYLEGFTMALREAEIMVVRKEKDSVMVDPQTKESLKKIFTDKPWTCAAGDFAQPKEYRILFRVGAR